MKRRIDRLFAMLLLPYLALIGANTPEWSQNAEILSAESRTSWSILLLIDDVGMDLDTDPEDVNDTGASITIQMAILSTTSILPSPQQATVQLQADLSTAPLQDLRRAPKRPPPEQ